MELISGVLCLLQVVDLFFKVKERIVTPQDKEAIHRYLKHVGYLLREVADNMERNIYPHEKCMEMLTHLNNIKQVLEGKVSNEHIDNLTTLIDEAYKVERMFGELQSLPIEQKNNNIEVIKNAAGAFIATSELVKL